MENFKNKIKKLTTKGLEIDYPKEESITDFLALALSKSLEVQKVCKGLEEINGCDFIIDYKGKTLGLQAKTIKAQTYDIILSKIKKKLSQSEIVASDPSKGYILYYVRSNGQFCILLLVRGINSCNEEFFDELKKDGAMVPDSNNSKEKDKKISVIEIYRTDKSLKAIETILR
ncbi:hypothetical protein ACTFIW_008109 [Dictyostelium discoideum]